MLWGAILAVPAAKGAEKGKKKKWF